LQPGKLGQAADRDGDGGGRRECGRCAHRDRLPHGGCRHVGLRRGDRAGRDRDGERRRPTAGVDIGTGSGAGDGIAVGGGEFDCGGVREDEVQDRVEPGAGCRRDGKGAVHDRRRQVEAGLACEVPGRAQRAGGGAHAVGPEVGGAVTEGGRAATLVLVARPNEDTEARTISIAFGTGKRAPRATGVAGGIVLAGDPIAVAILDDDLVALSVDDAKAKESKRWMRFTVRLSAKAEKPVTASFSTRSSSPVSAREGADYRKLDTRVRFEPGETEKEVKVRIFDDSHNEGPETFEVFLSRSSTGAGIADGVAVGTITNDDPLPGAWLARFGRAVAERALDGITARLAADRTPGLQGSIAGQSLDFAPAASDGADLAPGSGAGPGSLSGAGGAGFGQEAQSQARGMTMQEVLRGSSFSLTGEADSSGGTLAFWGGTPGSGGLVSGSRFSGDQRGDGTAVGLHGETATALLGTDYARGRWFVGFALSETRAEGGYAPIDGDAEASGGDVEASLTATIPYAALAVSDRLRLWGAAGQGAGDVTVKTGTESLRADTAWSMAAAGIRGDLLAPAAGSADGPSLALVSDALWVRTSSEKVSGLAASESDVSRLRLGLEGSWGLSLSDGGAVTPRLEFGARHDGGDAETGFGVELGGGLAWHDPKLGLRLDLSGRTLVAHDDGALEDRGVSAQLAYDPAPASGRGLSLSLGQDWGGRAQGGLDALFAPEPLEHRAPDRGPGQEAARRSRAGRWRRPGACPCWATASPAAPGWASAWPQARATTASVGD
ncbi:MAG: hypothetical protein F4Y03_04350, partial [Alphaproteobacteria bacterium]|nr:hypothetical protein [Alphaproteobacteria bacterium]